MTTPLLGELRGILFLGIVSILGLAGAYRVFTLDRSSSPLRMALLHLTVGIAGSVVGVGNLYVAQLWMLDVLDSMSISTPAAQDVIATTVLLGVWIVMLSLGAVALMFDVVWACAEAVFKLGLIAFYRTRGQIKERFYF